MDMFEKIEKHNHEEVLFLSDKNSGLRAIIAIHDTTLGPAIGGARMWNYESEEDALEDALRLSRGMTYKAAVTGLNLGGGKAIIMGNPKKDKSELLFRTFGKFVNGLGGRYITSEDMGTDVKDMEYVRMETKHVVGISKALGGSGNPSTVTAYGVFVGMKASAKEKWGSDSLKGKKIAIQGVGSVGRYLCEHLYHEGAELFITDIDEEKIRTALHTVKAHVVKPEEIYDVDCDIFSPNAIGSVINDETIPRLKCEIIAGGANSQLEDDDKHSVVLKEREILFAPDYVINAGGLINVANEIEGYRQDRAIKQAEGIYDILQNIYAIAKEQNISTMAASNHIAEERLNKIASMKNIYSNGVK
jgi:leucine dehydrogenase